MKLSVYISELHRYQISADIVSVAMESTRWSTRAERAQRRALKRDNRGGNAVANMEEEARGGDVEEVREAAGGGPRAPRRRGGQASVRGRGVGDDQDDVEVLQVAVAPGDQDVEEIRDEVLEEVLVDIDAADLAVLEVIDLEEEENVVGVAVMVAQVEEEVDDQGAVGVAGEGFEENVYEDAVEQIGDGQDDEGEHLEEQDDQLTEEPVEVAEADFEDGPALSDTIDLTDSPRPNRCA